MIDDYIKILPDTELRKRSTKTLLHILKKARAAMHKANNRLADYRYQDADYEGSDDEAFVDRHERYYRSVKAILSGREHVA